MTRSRKSSTASGLASYAVLARVLTALFAVDPPLDSRQVYAWHTRATRNKDGQAFPRPAQENAGARRGQPRYLFSVSAVASWYSAGVPDEHGKGWIIPQVAPMGVAAQKWNEGP
jgi:hypothetical protein